MEREQTVISLTYYRSQCFSRLSYSQSAEHILSQSPYLLWISKLFCTIPVSIPNHHFSFAAMAVAVLSLQTPFMLKSHFIRTIRHKVENSIPTSKRNKNTLNA